MKVVIFKGYDIALNAPRDWKPSRDGACAALPVRVTSDGRHDLLQSYWKPDAAELKALNEGYSICLSVVGRVHPPVMMHVQKVEEHELPASLFASPDGDGEKAK